MSINTAIKKQWRGFLNLNPSARYFIMITVMFGVFFAGWGLFFNFFILAKGFDRQFLGLTNSILPGTIMLFGIPMGMISDRLGRKRSMILGQLILLAGYLTVVFSSSGGLILLALFIAGVGESLFIVSETPLLMKLTTKENRSTLFSLNRGLSTLAGMVGSYFGGQLPLWFEASFGIHPETAASYQGVMMASVALSFLSFIPLWKIHEPLRSADNGESITTEKGKENRQKNGNLQEILRNPTVWKLFVPNLTIGVGAALLIPYLNLFFRERFNTSDQTLGSLFGIAALVTGLSTLFSPKLARITGTRIRAVVLAQGSSLLFLLLLGFSPWMGLAVIGFLGRNALMNMVGPLYDSFALEQVEERQHGTFNSLMMMSWEIGWTVGPFVSGLIQQRYGFTPIFVITAVLYGAAIAMIWFFFRDKEEVEVTVTNAALQST
jgi:MFS family permease